MQRRLDHEVAYKDGGKFIGHVVRQGFGIYEAPDKSKYEGMWHNDRRHGKGELTLANGDHIRGNWINDELHG